MRARSIGCALAAAALLIPSNASAVDSPCTVDASLCVGGGQPAACRSAGAIVSMADPSNRAVSESFATHADPNPHATTTAEVSVDPPTVPPLPRVHIGGLQSFCQAYLYGTGNVNHKACGRAGAEEVFIDLNPMRIPVIVSARGLFHDGCAATGIDGPGHNNTAVVQILTTIDGTLVPIELLGPTNSTVSPAEGVLIGFNEKWISEIQGCNANQGAALRILAGEAQIVIGWVSTSACV